MRWLQGVGRVCPELDTKLDTDLVFCLMIYYALVASLWVCGGFCVPVMTVDSDFHRKLNEVMPVIVTTGLRDLRSLVVSLAKDKGTVAECRRFSLSVPAVSLLISRTCV